MTRASTMISAGQVLPQAVQAKSACDLEKPSRVDMAFQELEIELERLSGVVHRLAGRLDPILGPQLDTPLTANQMGGPIAPVSALTATVNSARQRVTAIIEMVSQLTDRVEA